MLVYAIRNLESKLIQVMACCLKTPTCYLDQYSLQWRHNGLDCLLNHQPNQCLLNRLFGRRSNKTSKLRVTGLCAGNSPGTGEFPAQMASNAENVSIWWRHHDWLFINLVLWHSLEGRFTEMLIISITNTVNALSIGPCPTKIGKDWQVVPVCQC